MSNGAPMGISEAAKALNVAPKTLRGFISAGKGPRVMRYPNNRIFIDPFDLEAWKEERKQGGDGEVDFLAAVLEEEGRKIGAEMERRERRLANS